MQIKTNENKYGVVRKTNHWVVAIMFIALLSVGVYMTNIPVSDLKWELYGMHKSFGVLITLFIAFRLIWLKFDNRMDNSKLTKLERVGSASIHGLLYLLMLIMPISGMLMSMAHGYQVKVFNLFALPMLVNKNEQLANFMGSAHFYAGYFAIGLVVVHVLASLFHHFVKKDGILRRMI